MKRVLAPDDPMLASNPSPPFEDSRLDFRHWLARVQADLRVDPRAAGFAAAATFRCDPADPTAPSWDPGQTR